MLACLGWCILLVIVIAFMCCLMPWWLVLIIFGGMFIYVFFLSDDAIFSFKSVPPRPMKNLERVKREIAQQKKAEAQKNKNSKSNNTKTTKAKQNTYTPSPYRGNTIRHQQEDDSDYARYRAIREEQAAYDDFIASLDMDDK